VAATRHLDASLLAMQRHSGRFSLEPLATDDRLGQRFARTAAAFFSARLVHFVGAFGRIGQDQHPIARDLQEAAADGHRFFGTAPLDADDPRAQRGQQRRVPRQDTHDAFGARRDDHVYGVFGEDLALSSDNLYT
jgi:hypothetical protein